MDKTETRTSVFFFVAPHFLVDNQLNNIQETEGQENFSILYFNQQENKVYISVLQNCTGTLLLTPAVIEAAIIILL